MCSDCKTYGLKNHELTRSAGLQFVDFMDLTMRETPEHGQVKELRQFPETPCYSECTMDTSFMVNTSN